MLENSSKIWEIMTFGKHGWEHAETAQEPRRPADVQSVVLTAPGYEQKSRFFRPEKSTFRQSRLWAPRGMDKSTFKMTGGLSCPKVDFSGK